MYLSKIIYRDTHYINKWKSIYTYQHLLLHLPIKANPYIYLFLKVTINFITDLLESNRYNTLYIIADHNLTKAIVFILYIKIINIIRIIRLYHNNIYQRFGLLNRIILNKRPQFLS